MDKKKILIVSRSFFPINTPRSFRTTELAKEFARQGHEVKVITHKDEQLHPAFEKEHNIVIKDLGNLRYDEINLSGSGIVLLLRRVLRRFAKMLIEFPNVQYVSLVERALKAEKGYDLLISIAVPHPIHWGVAKIRTNQNKIAKVWIADCGDPFMGQENDSFKHPFYFKYVEKWFCKKADFITVPTQGSIDAYYPEFRDKIKVIPQGFKFSDIEVFKGVPNNTPVTFGYAGLFIAGRRDPSELLEYLNSIETDYRFHIYTTSTDLVKPFADKSNGRVILHSYIPREELLYKLSEMDFVVNFENVGAKQTPSKLIDYAIVGRPILTIRTGGLKPQVVEEFLNGIYSNRFVIENIEQYKIENVTKEFLSLKVN